MNQIMSKYVIFLSVLFFSLSINAQRDIEETITSFISYSKNWIKFHTSKK